MRIFNKIYHFLRYYMYQPFEYEVRPWNVYSNYYYVNYYDESIELMDMDYFS